MAMNIAVCVISSRTPEPEDEDRYKPLQSAGLYWIGSGEKRLGDTTYFGWIRYVDSGSTGLVSGRNFALTALDHDIIVFLDDDVHLPENWLSKITEPFGLDDAHFVGCRYLPRFYSRPEGWLKKLWKEKDGFRYLWQLSLLDGGPHSRYYDPTLVFGLCFAGRRKTMLDLGGFHPDGYPWSLRLLRGDGESALCLKAREAGLKAFYQGDTYVLHDAPKSRISIEYIKRRAFLEGISRSFSALRSGRGPETLRRTKMHSLLWQRIAGPSLHDTINDCMRAGFNFHWESAISNPKLLQWVLRDDYFSAVPPIELAKSLGDVEHKELLYRADGKPCF